MPQITCFGPFELNLETAELRVEGRGTRLPEQQFQILQMLLSAEGKVVSREEIRNRLWPNGTIVEFDRSINTAMMKLRIALGDTGDKPRLIETLPRRGYRLTVPIDEHIEETYDYSLHHQVETPESVPAHPPSVSDQAASAISIPWRGGSIAAALALISASAIWYLRPVALPRVTASTQLTYGSDPSWGIVTDGSRLYFREGRTEDQQIAQVSVAGGEVSVLPVPISHPVIADISPDHTQLLVSSTDHENNPLWIVPLPAGPPHKLGDLEVNGASWAPDGKHLLLTKANSLYLKPSDSNDLRKITSVPEGIAQCAGFSPDGSRIRFGVISRQVDSPTLWEVRSDGSNLHQLLPGWRAALECGGNWTPDGRYFLFGSDTADGHHDIFSMQESRGAFSKSPTVPIRLTFGPLRYEAPIVSLDEKKLFVYGWHQRGQLVHYDPASRQFLPFLGGISSETLSFSRDGKWIAYTTVPGYELWRSRVDGSERVQLTVPDAQTRFHDPRWSPDGKQIAVMTDVAGKSWKIVLVPADGGTAKPLLEENNLQESPTWSPDGNQIAFETRDANATDKSEIQIVDTRTNHLLTIPGSTGKSNPSWSPGGRYLAALSSNIRPTKIFLYDFYTQVWIEWTTDEDVSYLSWTADGHYVHYVQNNSRDQDSKVRRVKVGDSHPEDLFNLRGLRRFDGDFSPWTDIAPDGSQMFLRDTSGRDIYALDVEFP
jgi:Tol biopolymer transport system component/DNA-binding winged helix-turn-helix (wHTH) protein